MPVSSGNTLRYKFRKVYSKYAIPLTFFPSSLLPGSRYPQCCLSARLVRRMGLPEVRLFLGRIPPLPGRIPLDAVA